MPVGTFARVLHVDVNFQPADPLNPPPPDGSVTAPFLSIQDAVNAVGMPVDLASAMHDWTILIAPGDYDASVRIRGPVRLALIGLGPFRLGRYTVAASPKTNIVADPAGVPRDIEWVYDFADRVPAGGPAPQLTIGLIGGADIVRHGKALSNRISGSIIMRGDGWTAGNVPDGGTAFRTIAHTQVDGGITKTQPTAVTPAVDATAFTGTLVDRHSNCRFRGDVIGPLNAVAETPPAYVLAASYMSQYEGRVQVTSYASLDQVAIASGMTVSDAGDVGNLKSVAPPGFVNSTFAGTFTGPARSLVLDGVTHAWFIRNGASLSGGATITRVDGPRIHGARAGSTLRATDSGATLLVGALPAGDPGPATLTLPPSERGLLFTIKNVAPGPPVGPPSNLIIGASPGETIDGKATLRLGPLSVVTLVSHGGHWWIVGGSESHGQL